MPAQKGASHRPAHSGTAWLDRQGYFRARLRHGDRLFTASSKVSKATALRLVRAKHARWLRDGRTASSADRQTLGPYLDAWLHAVGRERKASSAATYARALKHLPLALRSVRLAELRPSHLDRAYAQLVESGATPATLRKVHTVLRVALRHALRSEPEAWGRLRDVLTAVGTPRHVVEERPHASAAQMRLLLAELEGEPTWHALGAVCCYCGLRLGEVLGLRWGDLSETAGTLRLERQSSHENRRLEELKHAKQKRTMALHRDLIEVLADHRRREMTLGRGKAGDLLFPGSDYRKTGLPSSHRAAWLHITGAAKRAGLPAGVAAHALRHGHATLALAAGASVKDVQERLGHSSIAVTGRYLHKAGTGDTTVARVVGDALRGG